jgi:hypothetical protein
MEGVGVYETEHAPEERLQEEGENVPAPLAHHVTIPVGEDPVTVAMHVVGDPTASCDEEQLIEVVVLTWSEITITTGVTLRPVA